MRSIKYGLLVVLLPVACFGMEDSFAKESVSDLYGTLLQVWAATLRTPSDSSMSFVFNTCNKLLEDLVRYHEEYRHAPFFPRYVRSFSQALEGACERFSAPGIPEEVGAISQDHFAELYRRIQFFRRPDPVELRLSISALFGDQRLVSLSV
ncbi:hypothetical protein JW872_03185 [Candidatus Babeliales bacterium]|nr:hypothetical protein [Candidatus Babeliales bacterium]